MSKTLEMWGKIYTGAFVAYAVIFYVYFFFTRWTKTIQVNEEFLMGQSRSVANHVVDQKGDVYVIRNSPLVLHFKAAEVAAKIVDFKEYKVKGYGLRLPILGLFPVITHAQTVQ